jgi:Zn-dependent M28 family amino/carboxypeptidase
MTDSFYNRTMRSRAIRRLLVVALVAAASFHLGAAASVQEWRSNRQRFSPSVGAAERAPQLDGEALRTLASPSFEGRRAGTAGGRKARAWIVERFKTIGLPPVNGSYEWPFAFARTANKGKVDANRASSGEAVDGANVVALCKGSNDAPETVVISAHYDHLGVRDGEIYPGADDNASGVAVMLALAEDCRRRRFAHDVLFVAFDAEELGLQGAKAFIAHPPLPLARIALDINLDMVSRSDKRELFVAGPYHWPKTRPPLEAVAKRAAVRVLFGHDKPASVAAGVQDWTNQSDHGPFHAAGTPFVYFGVEDHADYHKTTDTADKIDATFLRQTAETILDAARTLDAALPFDR